MYANVTFIIKCLTKTQEIQLMNSEKLDSQLTSQLFSFW